MTLASVRIAGMKKMNIVNIVEMIAEKSHASPCIHGNIVDDHACYCHHPDMARKCPVWRNFGEDDLSKWHRRDWPSFEIPMLKGFNGDEPIIVNEMRPMLPDDDIGGCPSFEPNNA